MKPEFKYEVAFSFCLEDEQKVNAINDFLSDRYSTFVYSKKQEELVGFDGVDKFSDVFATQSRLVVVFYRKKYGSTFWTKIEETSIKNRAMKVEDWDFTIYIPIEKNKIVPKYLPDTRIWFDYDKYGPEGAALIIEKRITDLGGKKKVELPIDKAKRLKKKIEYENKLNDYISGPKYFEDGTKEYERLKVLVKVRFQTAIAQFDPDHFKTVEEFRIIAYRFRNLQIELVWLRGFKSDTDRPIIKVNLVEFVIKDSFYDTYEPRILKEYTYTFYKNTLWEDVWKEEQKKSLNYYKSEVLADKIVSLFFDFVDKPDKFKSNIGFW
jgi:hypothetical protein